MMLNRVISGGQTGVDQAALHAAGACGLATGGWMPKGYRTEAGDNPDLARQYGLHEHQERGYPPRTQRNVASSDATLILGDPRSKGCTLTMRYCQQLHRPYFILTRQHWDAIDDEEKSAAVNQVKLWMGDAKVSTLNVAGNREETNPGIGKWARELLVRVFC